MSDKIFNEIYDAYQNRGQQLKKEDTHKWQNQIKLLHILDGKVCQNSH